VPRGGLEPPIHRWKQILLTTSAFAALSVCGLDYAFTIAYRALGG
jgi:hypothetical protein